MTGPRTRVFVVDDHEVVRIGLRTLLELESDMTVVGEAADGPTALRDAPRLAPDVVLMDIRLGVMDGIETCRALKSALPEVRVLMLTSFGTQEAVLGALMAGASGFLLKNAGHEELLRGIRAVAAGGSLLDPAVTRAVTDRLVQLATEGEHPLLRTLSAREREVLVLVARGDTNREIADRLVISETTARNHVSHILEKLGVRRRAEAAVLAAQIGLGTPSE